jgi:hypothetical protein
VISFNRGKGSVKSPLQNLQIERVQFLPRRLNETITPSSWCPSACDADPGNIAAYPPADITVERIGDLVSADPTTLLGNAVAGRAQQEES